MTVSAADLRDVLDSAERQYEGGPFTAYVAFSRLRDALAAPVPTEEEDQQ